MPNALFIKPFVSPLSHTNLSKSKLFGDFTDANINPNRRLEVVCLGMLAPRKFLQRRKKVEVFEDGADKADQKNWRKLMAEIDESESAVSVLQSRRTGNKSLPKDLVVGTLVRFKQLRKWNVVSEILEWLRTQHWWVFTEMDYLMLLITYGKQGEFSKTERVLSYMTKKGHAPNVISHTALMEAYGRGKQYKTAEAVFRRMQSSGPEPSAITYQIIFKTFVEGDKFKEAEEVFETLLNEESSPLKPDQKMFHMMIYMYKKAGNYEKARKVFGMMTERGIQRSTVTYNSLMSFETNYKEVANIYDEMQKAGLAPDVVSYALLVSAYGKARREEEALAVFEEMLDAGVRPTQKAYNILLDAFAISGMVEQARTVFKSMRRDRISQDICSYTTMLSAYVNAADMEGAERFFKRIKQDGLEASIVTYGALIKGYAKINNLERMMETYEEMRVCGIKANETIYTTIMDAYGKNKDFDSAVVWYKEMVSSRVVPDKKAKNILLSLAKTPEEQVEAKQLIGENIDAFVTNYENKNIGENVDDYEEDFAESGDFEEEEEQEQADDDDDEEINGDDEQAIALSDVHHREDSPILSSIGV